MAQKKACYSDGHHPFQSHFHFLSLIDFEHLPQLESKIAICGKMMMLHLRYNDDAWGAKDEDDT